MSTDAVRPVERTRRRGPVRSTAAVVVAVSLATAAWFAFGTDSDGPQPTGRSQLVAGGVTVSPAPGARDASPESELSFLGASRAQLGAVSVVGSRSGRHAGRIVAYASERGASFVPATRFDPGEHVTVTARGIRYGFDVSRPTPIPSSQQPLPARQVPTLDGATYASAPDLHPARVSVTRSEPGTAAGDLFLAPLGVSGARNHGQIGPLILDNAGNPVWQGSVPAGQVAMNFQPQTLDGKRVLTWWQGSVSPVGYGLGEHVVLDSSYRRIATINAGNGYSADLHELQLRSNGAAFVTAYRPVVADLRPDGGPANGELLSSVVQEIDIKTGRVMFEWNPRDHVGLRDSYTDPPTSAPWDAYHVNAIDFDRAGNMLITARNTWAVYKVNGRSGQLEWTLGGKHSSFKMPSHDRFAYEHDARFHAGDQVTLFDDQAAPNVGPQSRGLVFQLDLEARTAHAVKRYDHSPPLLSSSQGNLQKLANGNLLAGWGAQPYYSEFSGDGRLLYDVRLPARDESYRTFRAVWHGRPTAPPAIAVRGAVGGKATVYASWNGATDIASWRLVADGRTLKTAPRTGFETKIPATGQAFAVEALDASGHVLGRSATVSP